MKKGLLLTFVAVVGFATASFGQSLVFNDSANSVYLDDHITGLTDAQEAITLESWIKPDTTGGWNNWTASIYLRNDEGASLGLNIASDADGDTLMMVPLWQDIYWIEPGIYVPINKWSHIAMTVDVATNTMKGYLNGALVYTYTGMATDDDPDLIAQNCVGTTTNTVGAVVKDAPFTLGKDRYHETWFGRTYKGALDEVRVWNVALTDAEILASWNTKLVGDETGLVAYYDFTTVIGTIITNGGVGPTATIDGDDTAAGEEGAPTAITGINSRTVLQNVNVYAYMNTLYIENGNGAADVEVFNVAGQLVKSIQINGDASMELNGNNVYIIKVSGEKGVYTSKVLVK